MDANQRANLIVEPMAIHEVLKICLKYTEEKEGSLTGYGVLLVVFLAVAPDEGDKACDRERRRCRDVSKRNGLSAFETKSSPYYECFTL